MVGNYYCLVCGHDQSSCQCVYTSASIPDAAGWMRYYGIVDDDDDICERCGVEIDYTVDEVRELAMQKKFVSEENVCAECRVILEEEDAKLIEWLKELAGND